MDAAFAAYSSGERGRGVDGNHVAVGDWSVCAAVVFTLSVWCRASGTVCLLQRRARACLPVIDPCGGRVGGIFSACQPAVVAGFGSCRSRRSNGIAHLQHMDCVKNE